MSIPTSDRGSWSSKTGFILAAAGSAIGLGNIWRFPYTAGENGGGAFVLIYALFVVIIGMPVLYAELSVGRTTRKNPVGAFKALVPDRFWPAVGGLGVATGFGILAFYSVVSGWTLGYLVKALSGDFGAVTTSEESGRIFGELVSNPWEVGLLTAVFMALTMLVVRGGVSGGIERATKILMPALFVLLILLAVRSLTLPGAMAGVEYLFRPDFSRITVGVVLSALGQALFSLSLGMGAMITYGSYFPDGENLPQAGASVAVFDTMIAILAGLIIFPALFSAGVEPDSGPGLVFIVLPTIFGSLPAGELFGIAFYFLLCIAALTSTISLLEVAVAYFVDEAGWSRERAVFAVGSICFLLAIPSALSQGAVRWLGADGPLPWDFLTLNNNLWGNYSLSLGAILICLFVGWRWGVEPALASLEGGGFRLPAAGVWSFLIRFVCPLAIAFVLGYILVSGQYF